MDHDRSTLEGLVKTLITDRDYCFDGAHTYSTAFDASYGWEEVMQDAFLHMAPYLEDGSSISISPDSGLYEARIEGGCVKEEYLSDLDLFKKEVMGYISRCIKAAAKLDEETGGFLSFMDATEYGVDDSIFKFVDSLRDGDFEDEEAAMTALMETIGEEEE